MEVQLAELAMKDALFYKSQSQPSGGSVCSHEDIVTTKSHHQFMNGELECFSHGERTPETSFVVGEGEEEDEARGKVLGRPASSSLLEDIIG